MWLVLLFFIPVIILGISYFRKQRNEKKNEEEDRHYHLLDEQTEKTVPIYEEVEDGSLFAVIYSTGQIMEAQFLAAKLESLDIPCELYDVNTISINPLFSNAIGGVKIAVLKEDAQRALEIIHEVQNAPILNEDGSPLKCPRCSSDDFFTDYKSYSGKGGIVSGLMAASIFNAAIGSHNVYKCKVCGHEFEQK